MDIEKRTAISRELFYSVRRLDILQDLIEDRGAYYVKFNSTS